MADLPRGKTSGSRRSLNLSGLRCFSYWPLTQCCALRFQAGNRVAQPASQGIFNFLLCSAPVQIIQCFAGLAQWDMPAGHFLSTALGGNELHQKAVVAWAGMAFCVIVHARGRVLKDELGPPGLARRMAIPALPKEVEFELQDFQSISSILRHDPPPTAPIFEHFSAAGCDRGHSA